MAMIRLSFEISEMAPAEALDFVARLQHAIGAVGNAPSPSPAPVVSVTAAAAPELRSVDLSPPPAATETHEGDAVPAPQPPAEPRKPGRPRKTAAAPSAQAIEQPVAPQPVSSPAPAPVPAAAQPSPAEQAKAQLTPEQAESLAVYRQFMDAKPAILNGKSRGAIVIGLVRKYGGPDAGTISSLPADKARALVAELRSMMAAPAPAAKAPEADLFG